jgi:hypothetical protein
LPHKAVCYIVRQVGNSEMDIEEEFLQEHYIKMPRTILRYAFEKIPEKSMKMYLKGEV